MNSEEGFFVRVVAANGAHSRGGYAGGRSKPRPYDRKKSAGKVSEAISDLKWLC
jgi:hypothetical protein